MKLWDCYVLIVAPGVLVLLSEVSHGGNTYTGERYDESYRAFMARVPRYFLFF